MSQNLGIPLTNASRCNDINIAMTHKYFPELGNWLPSAMPLQDPNAIYSDWIYDFYSIMDYPSIQNVDPNSGEFMILDGMGQISYEGKRPTPLDKRKLAEMYPPPPLTAAQLAQFQGQNPQGAQQQPVQGRAASSSSSAAASASGNSTTDTAWAGTVIVSTFTTVLSPIGPSVTTDLASKTPPNKLPSSILLPAWQEVSSMSSTDSSTGSATGSSTGSSSGQASSTAKSSA
jgi:hypothetical protein